MTPGAVRCPRCGAKIGGEEEAAGPEEHRRDGRRYEDSRYPGGDDRRGGEDRYPGGDSRRYDSRGERRGDDSFEDEDEEERNLPVLILTGAAIFGAVLMVVGLILMITM